MNALTVSQPVKACMPIRHLQSSPPTAPTTLEILTYLVLVCAPHLTCMDARIKHLNARQSKNMSVSSDATTTALWPDLAAWAAWAACRISLVSASSRVELSSSTVLEASEVLS